jgi:glycosyltransferase involved in cell wall biosynthesis
MKRLKYIASFDLDSNKNENRVNMLSSANKINYMLTVMNELGIGVDIISTSHTLNKKCYGGKVIRWGDNTLKLFPTTWRGGVVLKIINLIILRTTLFFYLTLHVKGGEKVMMYHSYGNIWINSLLKWKGVKIIEECEEIYGDIFGKPKLAEREKKALQSCFAYIYPTRLLNDIVNKKGAPYMIIHGAYKDVGSQFFDDAVSEEPTLLNRSKFHVAYTGILDPKKGCIEVVRAAEYLDSDYHIHILGFGDKDAVEKEIEKVKTKTKCEVTYDGLRKGAAYSQYLSKLDLGVCTLNTDQGFVNTQFPSKIISYMAAGVPVLCSNVEAIKTSDVAEAITFYEGNAPQDIAKGIIVAREKEKIDAKKLLNDCHERFKKEIYELIK